MGAVELLPCPFCGGDASLEDIGSANQACLIACTRCGCWVQSSEIGYGEAWNRRVPTPVIYGAAESASSA